MAADFANANWDTLTAMLASGQCGIVYGNWWLGNADKLYNPETMELGDWIVIEGVTPDGSSCMGYSNATPGQYLFVKNGIQHPEAVVKMINLQFKLLVSPYYHKPPDFTNQETHSVDSRLRSHLEHISS